MVPPLVAKGMNAWTFESIAVACVVLTHLDASGQLNKTSALAIRAAAELASHDEQQHGHGSSSRTLTRGDFYGHPMARLNNTSDITQLTTTSLESIVMTDATISNAIIVQLFQQQALHGSGAGVAALLHVHLRGCKLIEDDALYALGQHCKRLRVLLLGACELLTDRGVIALTTGQWPKVPVKDGEGKERQQYVPKTAAMLKNVAKAKSSQKKIKKKKNKNQKKFDRGGCVDLRRLGVCGCWRLTDITIKTLTKHCPMLQILDVRECDQLTNVSLDYIQTNLFHLEQLSMCGLAKLDKDRLGRLARALPLVGPHPHYRGAHVILASLNKAWLMIQKKRAWHRRSAIAIQKGTRKYFASKRSLSFKIARAELIVLKRKNMAVRIQARVRGIADRIFVKEERKRMVAIRRARRKAAAIRLQACIRRWLACLYVHNLRKAMQYLLIRAFRRYKRIVQQIIFRRQTKACQIIQKSYRAYSCRTAYRRIIAYRNAQARRIQKIWRGVIGREYEHQSVKLLLFFTTTSLSMCPLLCPARTYLLTTAGGRLRRFHPTRV